MYAVKWRGHLYAENAAEKQKFLKDVNNFFLCTASLLPRQRIQSTIGVFLELILAELPFRKLRSCQRELTEMQVYALSFSACHWVNTI